MADDAIDASAADDEHTLVARIAAGDHEALHILYTRYHSRLWRYLWRRLDGNSGSVEDVLQEIWLAVWRAAPGFRPEGPVAAWIYQIAHHRVAHVLRDHARRPEGHLQAGALDLRDAVGFAVAPSSSYEQQVVDRLALLDALRALSPAHREALELVFQHGFSLAEVADILDVPLGTVKSRVSYARRALARAVAIVSADAPSAAALSAEGTSGEGTTR